VRSCNTYKAYHNFRIISIKCVNNKSAKEYYRKMADHHFSDINKTKCKHKPKTKQILLIWTSIYPTLKILPRKVPVWPLNQKESAASVFLMSIRQKIQICSTRIQAHKKLPEVKKISDYWKSYQVHNAQPADKESQILRNIKSSHFESKNYLGGSKRSDHLLKTFVAS
jgi:hypothetical protein